MDLNLKFVLYDGLNPKSVLDDGFHFIKSRNARRAVPRYFNKYRIESSLGQTGRCFKWVRYAFLPLLFFAPRGEVLLFYPFEKTKGKKKNEKDN
jgi:hypothetical protein